ncbi:MAG: hypothetical protein IKJ47_00630 [Oscillospiraceae bacterium]|nr:hypothetical protein [Oscillospiraceae bacterium]
MKKIVKICLIVLVAALSLNAILYFSSPKTRLKYSVLEATDVSKCSVYYGDNKDESDDKDVLVISCSMESTENAMETMFVIKDIINNPENSELSENFDEAAVLIYEGGLPRADVDVMLYRDYTGFYVRQIRFFKGVKFSELSEFDLPKIHRFVFNGGILLDDAEDFKNFTSLRIVNLNMDSKDFDDETLKELQKTLPDCVFYFNDCDIDKYTVIGENS